MLLICSDLQNYLTSVTVDRSYEKNFGSRELAFFAVFHLSVPLGMDKDFSRSDCEKMCNQCKSLPSFHPVC